MESYLLQIILQVRLPYKYQYDLYRQPQQMLQIMQVMLMQLKQLQNLFLLPQ